MANLSAQAFLWRPRNHLPKLRLPPHSGHWRKTFELSRACTCWMAVRGPNVAGTLSSDAAFDYVFSQNELDDVLSFMERQQDDTSANMTNIAFLSNAPPASVSLQFQPHPSGFSGNPFPGLGLDQGLNGAQPYLSQIESDPFSSQAMGHPDSLGFDLGVQLEPELNPLHQGSMNLGPQSRIKAEPMSGMEPAGLRSPLEGSTSPSPNHAGSLRSGDSLPNAAGALVKSEAQPLSAAFAKLGSGGLSSPAPRPRQYSSEMHPGTGATVKRGEWNCSSFFMLYGTLSFYYLYYMHSTSSEKQVVARTTPILYHFSSTMGGATSVQQPFCMHSKCQQILCAKHIDHTYFVAHKESP